MIKSPKEIAQAGKESIEALTKSSAALANGLNEVNQHMIAIVQKSVTAQSIATKDVLGIKTSSDWAELHSRWAVEWMTSTISHLTDLSQLSTKAMHQAYEPIQKHCDATFRKISGSSS
jgi:hypothetical protein